MSIPLVSKSVLNYMANFYNISKTSICELISFVLDLVIFFSRMSHHLGLHYQTQIGNKGIACQLSWMMMMYQQWKNEVQMERGDKEVMGHHCQLGLVMYLCHLGMHEH